jgi:tetratricopeptide (TPR) repeat protein
MSILYLGGGPREPPADAGRGATSADNGRLCRLCAVPGGSGRESPPLTPGGRQEFRQWPFYVAYAPDRLEDALAFAERALTLARERSQRPYEAWALRLLGEVAARRDAQEHADGHYRGALVLARELGMLPLVAHCHLGLGKLYRRTDKREEAQQHLATATMMYREMGMTYWLEKAEIEMRELGG